MKLAIVTLDEFNEIWSMLSPQDRMFAGPGMLGASIVLTDTLIVVGAKMVNYDEVLSDVKRAIAEATRRREARRSENKPAFLT
jgi:hypothetical protein